MVGLPGPVERRWRAGGKCRPRPALFPFRCALSRPGPGRRIRAETSCGPAGGESLRTTRSAPCALLFAIRANVPLSNLRVLAPCDRRRRARVARCSDRLDTRIERIPCLVAGCRRRFRQFERRASRRRASGPLKGRAYSDVAVELGVPGGRSRAACTTRSRVCASRSKALAVLMTSTLPQRCATALGAADSDVSEPAGISSHRASQRFCALPAAEMGAARIVARALPLADVPRTSPTACRTAERAR